MIASPRRGQEVQIWYRKSLAARRPLHGQVGVVAIPSRGRPRNHGVVVEGVLHVVPCGNLREVPPGRPATSPSPSS